MNAVPSSSPIYPAWRYTCLGAVLLSVGFLVLRPPTSSALIPGQEPGQELNQELSQELNQESSQKPNQIVQIAVTPQLPATDHSLQPQIKPQPSQPPSKLTLGQYTRCLARELELDEPLALAVLIQESDAHNPMKQGRRGGRGPLQIRPGALEEVGLSRSEHSLPILVYGGLRYLKTMLSRFDDQQTALAAYNMGPTRLRERGNRLYRVTERYVDQVLRRMDRIRSSDQVPYHPVLKHRLSEYRLSLDHHNIAPLRACLAL